eukprot:12898498-Prorocentrum_lima.AAC.1
MRSRCFHKLATFQATTIPVSIVSSGVNLHPGTEVDVLASTSSTPIQMMASATCSADRQIAGQVGPLPGPGAS